MAVPSIVLEQTEIISNYQALLSMYLNDNGQDTAYYFEYSTDIDFTQSFVTPTQILSNNSGNTLVSFVISNLIPGVSYYYRGRASNGSGNTISLTKVLTAKRIDILNPDVSFRADVLGRLKPKYVDFNQFSPAKTGQIFNVQAVMQSLFNLFKTRRRSMFFNNGYGADLDSLVFELTDSKYLELIVSIFGESIDYYEPRVFIDWFRTQVNMYIDDHVTELFPVFSLKEDLKNYYNFKVSI